MCSPIPGSNEMPEDPDHSPIDVDEQGDGPVFGEMIYATACWCGKPGCLEYDL
jgi:hypothetical protein